MLVHQPHLYSCLKEEDNVNNRFSQWLVQTSSLYKKVIHSLCVSTSLHLWLTDILWVTLRNGWNPIKIRPSQGLIHILHFEPVSNGFEVFHQS